MLIFTVFTTGSGGGLLEDVLDDFSVDSPVAALFFGGLLGSVRRSPLTLGFAGFIDDFFGHFIIFILASAQSYDLMILAPVR